LAKLLTDTVRDEIRQRVRMFPPDDVRVERSMPGDKAAIWGGAALAMRGGEI
jgi:hypothetical protein